MRTPAAITALGLGLALAACGGGGGEKDSPAASIAMADLKFEPQRITVRRGEAVRFVNRGKVTHNAKGKGFFSRVVEPGGSYSHRFSATGTFDYVCTFHPGMEGTITVR